ncbi:Tetratricopeptide repeat protein 27 [Hondaea fermentalgiana]|uniref:Tetratricopeptide repeat protein 27 n=1 Tax=Hondaea fermentalgiana TaxID=2315210 RepID=A0A2R5GHE9_9STRA|nr:Tetratricopeptide repeat protein 27 [Hondaea fermentalgiana]|eukprot:GBG30326.1 Tetratricopeptide repeat protein 27 [Hondaea fermentalgiana]
MEAAQAALDEANRLRSLGKFGEALREYNRAQKAHPRVQRKPGYLVQRGATLVGLDRVEEGLACFDRALHKDPDSAPAWFKKGTAHKRLRQFEEAVAAFRKACELAPDLDQAHVNLVRTLLLAKDYQASVDAARNAFENLQIAKARITIDKLWLLACAKLRNDAAAAEPAERLANIFQSDPSVLDEEMCLLVSRALAFGAASGDAARNLALAKLACTVESSFENILRLGTALLEAGETKAARHSLILASRVDQEDWRPHFHLGVLEFEEGNFRRSAARLQHALDLSVASPPSSPRTRRRSSLESSSSVRFGDAIRREGRGKMLSRLQLCLAAALLNGGDPSGARLAIMSSAHSQGSVRNHARVLLAAMELNEGNLAKAMHALNVARREVDDAVFESRPRTASVQHSARFVNFDVDNGLPPDDDVISRIVRLHLLTAKLAEIVRLRIEQDDATGNLQANGGARGVGQPLLVRSPRAESRSWANPSPAKISELERTCLNDVLKRDPDNVSAKKLLQGLDKISAMEKKQNVNAHGPGANGHERATNESDSRVVPGHSGSASPPHQQQQQQIQVQQQQQIQVQQQQGERKDKPPLLRAASCGNPGSVAVPSAMTSAEKLKYYAEQDAKREAFLEKLRARRRALEHDLVDHSQMEEASSDSDF